MPGRLLPDEWNVAVARYDGNGYIGTIVRYNSPVTKVRAYRFNRTIYYFEIEIDDFRPFRVCRRIANHANSIRLPQTRRLAVFPGLPGLIESK